MKTARKLLLRSLVISFDSLLPLGTYIYIYFLLLFTSFKVTKEAGSSVESRTYDLQRLQPVCGYYLKKQQQKKRVRVWKNDDVTASVCALNQRGAVDTGFRHQLVASRCLFKWSELFWQSRYTSEKYPYTCGAASGSFGHPIYFVRFYIL